MVATLSSIVLGLVFVVAGISKVASRSRWPEQAAGLGTPQPVAVVVPWVEIVVGALLVARLAMPWTAVVALVLLGAFTGLVLVHLDDDRRPPCACFGAWSTRPLSWWSVARNVVLAALAVLALSA